MQTRPIFRRGRRSAAVSLLSSLSLLAVLLVGAAAPARAQGTGGSGGGGGGGDLETTTDFAAPTTTASLQGTEGTNSWYTGPVQVSLSATDAVSTVAATVYRVDGGDWQTYEGAFSVSSDGAHTVDFHSTDSQGNIEAIQSVSFKIDQTVPDLTLPASPVTATATSTAGALVTFSLGASDSTSELAPDSPSASPASGSLFSLGTTTVNVWAADNAGNTANASFTVQVTYAWSGVLQPINPEGYSVFKAGSTVPVKFQLTGASAGITDLVATLSIAKISDNVVGTEFEAVSTSAASTGNRFRYDATSGQYTFNWGTRGLSSGTYQLRIDLGDGASHTVQVSLK